MTTIYTLPVVLLMSRDVGTRKFFKATLKGHFNLLEGENKRSAWNHLENTFFDLIIVDDEFSSGSILELCQEIRKIKGCEQTPLLLISTNLTKKFTSQAHNAGVNDFLHRPLDEAEVFQRIAVASKTKKVEKKVTRVSTQIKKGAEEHHNDSSLHEKFLLDAAAIKEITRAKKMAESLSILMIGIDKFKKEEMENIHEPLAALLKKQLRQQDSLFPQGSGKFIILLPKTSTRAAQQIAENIRAEAQGELPVTVSVGIVSFDESLPESAKPYEHFDRMMEKVHQALTEAQKKGNRIISS